MSNYLVILLLTSGGVTLCSQIYHEHHLVNEAKTWDEARSYCRDNYTDLATIYNYDDMEWLVNMTPSVLGTIWIGLGETGPESWGWSVGETGMSYESPTYSNWAILNEIEGSGEVTLVLQNMTWQMAQQYCRQHYMDLASARNPSENQLLQQVFSRDGSPALVWIGLFKDKWKWTDQSNSSFRYWASGQPNNDGDCTLFSINGWFDRGCQTKFPFFCYNEIEPSVKRIVRLKIKSDSPLQFQDFAVSDAILIEIQKQIEGAKLRWITKPDGRIFHNKQEEKDNDGSSDN
ncbi:macrophage mannose receptor 1-like [Platichthys flesus]|uniref:macrophage mannose receptor 1-like n=1 Tax=Platichthys flesus TaxID=8260 RepID=UPI002DB73F7E|nr:macrophage mannose receptor 1-like [Platichthys flesus]